MLSAGRAAPGSQEPQGARNHVGGSVSGPWWPQYPQYRGDCAADCAAERTRRQPWRVCGVVLTPHHPACHRGRVAGLGFNPARPPSQPQTRGGLEPNTVEPRTIRFGSKPPWVCGGETLAAPGFRGGSASPCHGLMVGRRSARRGVFVGEGLPYHGWARGQSPQTGSHAHALWITPAAVRAAQRLRLRLCAAPSQWLKCRLAGGPGQASRTVIGGGGGSDSRTGGHGSAPRTRRSGPHCLQPLRPKTST